MSVSAVFVVACVSVVLLVVECVERRSVRLQRSQLDRYGECSCELCVTGNRVTAL